MGGEVVVQFTSTRPVARPISNLAGWMEFIGMAKYLWCFEYMTYEEFLDITADALDRMNFHQDDRDHLYTSIMGLNLRNEQLLEIRGAIAAGEPDLPELIKILNYIAKTPMKSVKKGDTIANNISLDFLDVFDCVYSYLARTVPKNASFVESTEQILEIAEQNEIWPANYKALSVLKAKFLYLRENKKPLSESHVLALQEKYSEPEKAKQDPKPLVPMKETFITTYAIELDMSLPSAAECLKPAAKGCDTRKDSKEKHGDDFICQKERDIRLNSAKHEPQKIENVHTSAAPELRVEAFDHKLEDPAERLALPKKVSVNPLRAAPEKDYCNQQPTELDKCGFPPLPPTSENDGNHIPTSNNYVRKSPTDGLTNVQAYWYWDKQTQLLKQKKQEIFQRIQRICGEDHTPKSTCMDAFLDNPSLELMHALVMDPPQSETNNETDKMEPEPKDFCDK